MRAVRRDDIKDLTAYERIRSDFRRKVIDLRERRRIQAGEKISIVFENRETVLYQIQEMLRAERIVDEEGIAHELATYNELLPQKGGLAGTLFLELTDPERIREDLDAFLGLDRGEHAWFDLGSAGRAAARFAEGAGEKGRISSVHYVRFSFASAQVDAFRELAKPVEFVVAHPNYGVRVGLEDALRRELASDFDEE